MGAYRHDLRGYLTGFVLAAILTCAVLEVAITFHRSRAIVWPASAMLTGSGVALILRVPGTSPDERLVVLNRVAKSVIDDRRGEHPVYVFTYHGRRVTHMNNSAWKAARIRAGLTQVRVHDLKHSFGRRLRAAGVSFEDRQDLLGHKSGRITTHYSAAELTSLIAAAERVCAAWHRRRRGRDETRTPAHKAKERRGVACRPRRETPRSSPAPPGR